MNAPQHLAGVLALLIALPCSAHHSYSMFDGSRTVTLEGTVREFQWTNPHCFIQLLVASPDARTQPPVEWSIELVDPGALYRAGARPTTFRAGDRVTVVIHPLRDGTHGGFFVSAADSTGRTLIVMPKRPRT
jgi:Family of unknown function (DUF6152)